MCMIDTADYKFNVLTDENRKARKTHQCCECWRVINPGEFYNYQAGVGDGDFQSFKCCSHCVVARDFIEKKCHGFMYEGVSEDLSEHIHVKEWGFKAARFYLSMRRKWKKFYSDDLMAIPGGVNA